MVRSASASLLLAALLLALGRIAANDVHVHVRVHRHEQHTLPALTQAPRRVFHVTGSKAAFDQVLTPAVQKQLQLDVRRIVGANHGGFDTLVADISATDAAMATLQAEMTSSTTGRSKTKAHGKTTMKLHVKQADYLTDEERIAIDRKEVGRCMEATTGYQDDLESASSYTKSDFFNCFRPLEEITAFFDTVAKLNPTFVTKIPNVSKTYEGRSIHAYKVSTTAAITPGLLGERKPKTSVYTQALIHAREWQAGASTHYTFASMVDDLRGGDEDTIKLLEDVDVYFVPVVNADGYKYSWDVDRYWRTNRHPSNGYEGVDLNRNYPPQEYFNLDENDVSEETNPGEKPLSEQATKGLYSFMMGLPGLIGVMDVHAYAGMVLRPFSDVQGEPEEPYGSQMKHLGDSVRDAMSPTEGGFQYISQPAGQLYPAYGCLDDAVFRMTNYTVPALTIEVEGDDFIVPQSTIRDVGEDLNNGLRHFIKEAQAYRSFIDKLAAEK